MEVSSQIAKMVQCQIPSRSWSSCYIDQTSRNSQACLPICQLIRFNSKEKPKVAEKPHHQKTKEPLLPLYIGLSVHTQTRSKKMLTYLHELGISVSYKRVLEVEDWLTNAVCEQYQEEGLVCPVQVLDGVFTAGTLDNLDHNPTSQTAEGSFHGTSISVFQFPAQNNQETSREPIKIPQASTRNPSLPDDYWIVPAVACNTDTVNVTEAAAMEDTEPEPVLCETICEENQSGKDTSSWKGQIRKRWYHGLGHVSFCTPRWSHWYSWEKFSKFWPLTLTFEIGYPLQKVLLWPKVYVCQIWCFEPAGTNHCHKPPHYIDCCALFHAQLPDPYDNVGRKILFLKLLFTTLFPLITSLFFSSSNFTWLPVFYLEKHAWLSS